MGHANTPSGELERHRNPGRTRTNDTEVGLEGLVTR